MISGILARQPSVVSRHRFLLLLLASAIAVPGAGAQTYPERPIRMVAATSPGGLTDLLARLAAISLGPMLGQTVVVDNRPGATGNVAGELVAKSPPDGHTLLMISGGNIVIAPYLYRLPYDPVSELAPVFNMAEAPHLLCVPGSLPVKDLREFISYARANPGKINYASAGTGSTPHLSADHFARLAGIQVVHVPYKGIGPALPDVVAGRIQMIMITLGSARPHLANGALKPLAVSSKQRLAGIPEVPTAAEAGLPGWEVSTWFGVFAARGTSAAILRLLNGKLQAVTDDPKTRQRLLDFGAEPVGGSVQSFGELVRSDYRAWGQVVRESGVKLE